MKLLKAAEIDHDNFSFRYVVYVRGFIVERAMPPLHMYDAWMMFEWRGGQLEIRKEFKLLDEEYKQDDYLGLLLDDLELENEYQRLKVLSEMVNAFCTCGSMLPSLQNQIYKTFKHSPYCDWVSLITAK